MIVVGTGEQGRRHRRELLLPGAVDYFKGEWMESGTDPVCSPTVFLIEQSPNFTVRPHFHRNNEYQVFVQGTGLLGRHVVQPVTVHYAGAYTGYGPLVSGSEGLFYFTLRPAFETGPLYVAEDRDAMRRGPKHQRSSDPIALGEASTVRTTGTTEVHEILPLTADGGMVQLYRLPPDGTARGLAPRGSGGQFVMLLAGSIVHGGMQLHRWESLFLSPDEAPLELAAASSGAEVLLMQMPKMADEYLNG